MALLHKFEEAVGSEGAEPFLGGINREERERHPAQNVGFGHKAPHAAVDGVAAAIAHHKVVAFGNDERAIVPPGPVQVAVGKVDHAVLVGQIGLNRSRIGLEFSVNEDAALLDAEGVAGHGNDPFYQRGSRRIVLLKHHYIEAPDGRIARNTVVVPLTAGIFFAHRADPGESVYNGDIANAAGQTASVSQLVDDPPIARHDGILHTPGRYITGFEDEEAQKHNNGYDAEKP